MNECAFPDCSEQIVASEDGTIIGEVCHIRAQKPGGPRYVAEQSDEERHGFDNLILMCGKHHKIIDTPSNVQRYSIEWLIEVKQKHEEQGRASGEIPVPSSVVAALLLTVTVYEPGSVHMDFRNAYFKVGGDGGGPFGGGGAGGVLTIYGIAALPKEIADDITIELDGEPGQGPGAGGGGGGVLIYKGRPANEEDVVDGLSVPFFLPADNIQLADGVFFILCGGWHSYFVPQFPFETLILVAMTVEFGSIDPNALIAFEFFHKSATGTEKSVGAVDVGLLETRTVLNRNNVIGRLACTIDGPGVHEISVRSGGGTLARYRFEAVIR